MTIKKLFWDVDTQYDFMKKNGALYVPEAESIISTVNDVRRFALEHTFPIVASTDFHDPEDTEISHDPDFSQTFPPHCMAGTPGVERVGSTGDRDISYIPPEGLPEKELEQMASCNMFHIVIRKKEFDVFSNPAAEKLLRSISPNEIIVFGVALDVCVYAAVSGFLNRKTATITLIKDAVKGLEVRPSKEIFAEFRDRGVRIITYNELKEDM